MRQYRKGSSIEVVLGYVVGFVEPVLLTNLHPRAAYNYNCVPVNSVCFSLSRVLYIWLVEKFLDAEKNLKKKERQYTRKPL